MKKTKPALTIGMAHIGDYDGLYFTVQSLKLHHDVSDVELIVVDNGKPEAPEQEPVKGLVSGWSNQDFHSTNLIQMPNSSGTTQTRQRIFDEAKADYVVVMDCHVLLPAGAIDKLKAYYRENPESRDLLSGPLLMDSVKQFSTHFDPVWRSQMWGIWSQAFECRHCDFKFSIRPSQPLSNDSKIEIRDIMGNGPVLTKCKCGDRFPDLPYANHKQALNQLGYTCPGYDEANEPFEIPGMGLGCFSMSKKYWPGFNQHCQGFGGEEMVIHEKVRQRGGKALCVPFLKWNHRFKRVGGPPYRISIWNKVRNYVLGFRETGMDLEPVRKHFIDELGIFSQFEWNQIVSDPIKATEPNRVFSKEGLEQPPSGLGIDELYQWTKTRKRDLDEHFDTLRAYAMKSDHVTEVTKRRESCVALLGGRPKKLISFVQEIDNLTRVAVPYAAEKDNVQLLQIHGAPTNMLEETDFMFLDDQHNGVAVLEQLNLWAPIVRRAFAIHDTRLYGMKGDAGPEGGGLLDGIKKFIETHQDWFIAEHHGHQFGMTIISRHLDDKPEKPVIPWPIGWGPGTELKKLLSKIGITATENCKCNARAEEMDREGVAWCQLNEIKIVDWLEEEAINRKSKLFTRAGGHLITKLAVRKAKKIAKQKKA